MVNIGQLRSVVQFKVNVPTAAGAGFDDAWSDYGTVRGWLDSKSGRKQSIAGEIAAFNSFDLYIRYQPYYDKRELMAVIDGREFSIDTVIHMQEGKKTYLKFTLAEKIDA